ncbi:Ig domain-containing protein, partial [Paenibacillus sp. TAF58]
MLNASITPTNATNTNMTWTSSDANVATVNNGLVTALNQGIAGITATTQDGGYQAASIVQVGGNLDITVPNYTATTTFGASISGNVVASDAAGHALSYTKLAEPGHGTLNVKNDGTWTYKPNPGNNTSDLFYVGVNDHNESSTYSTITVTIQPLSAAMTPYTNVHPR